MDNKVKVLVIDDRPECLSSVLAILEEAVQYSCRTATTSQAAFTVLNIFHPDIILLSAQIEGACGFDICSSLRRDPRYRFVRILMVLDDNLRGNRLHGYKVGADDFICRPFPAQELLAKMKLFSRLTMADEMDLLRKRRQQTEDALRKSEAKHRSLVKIALALTAEKNLDTLLEMIVREARKLSGADGGTLYMLDDQKQLLRFRILQNDSMGINLRTSDVTPDAFPPIPLWINNKHNYTNVASFAALNDEIVDIPDVYGVEDFDFTGPKKYDAATGYRSKSMLVVPIKNQSKEVIGVIQLINAQDQVSGKVVAFDCDFAELVSSLASQAAMAIINMELVDGLRQLLYSFVKSIAVAVDEKSPFTGGHIKRVYHLTMLIAKTINKSKGEPFADIFMSEDEMEELRLAAWMHDIGKITVPEYVVDKETKLQTIFKRAELIKTRFSLAKKVKEAAFWRHKAESLTGCQDELQADWQNEKRSYQSFDDDLDFIDKCDNGSEYMADEQIEHLRCIAARIFEMDGVKWTFLTDDEFENLCVRKGTLNTKERRMIENHTSTTWKMLSQLPFPEKMANIPEFASGHHERLDGSGYHLGLSAEKIPLQVRILAIADIFEALTAKDRPYRKPMKLSQALKIMDKMKKEGHIDADILHLFIEKGVFLAYAQAHMAPEQIDL